MSDKIDNNIPHTNISSEGAGAVNIHEHGRDIHMYKVADMELDTLKNNYDSWSLGFCTLCLGAFFGFLVPLVTIQLSDNMRAIFIALTVMFFILSLFFGNKWRNDRAAAKKLINQIKERPCKT